MEEEIKEEAKEIAKSEECCKKDGKFKFHHCCGSKGNKIFLAIAIAIFIFGSGVCLGLHAGRNRTTHNFRQFPTEQRNGGRMMRGNDNIQNENGGCRGENGGCRFQGRVNQDQVQGQVQGQIEVQTQVPAQVQQVQTQTAPAATIQVVAPTQIKTATPAK